MKAGRRALGIAESYRGDPSTLAGAVVRADRTVDGAAFDSCTVGGTDVTERILQLDEHLDREDIAHVLVSGIALAWFNLVDLRRLHETLELPVIGVTYEAGRPLAESISEHFTGTARAERLAILERQPARRPVSINDHRIFIRPVGVPDEAAERVIQAHTAAGGRPEPLRVARLLARAADTWRARGWDGACQAGWRNANEGEEYQDRNRDRNRDQDRD